MLTNHSFFFENLQSLRTISMQDVKLFVNDCEYVISVLKILTHRKHGENRRFVRLEKCLK